MLVMTARVGVVSKRPVRLRPPGDQIVAPTHAGARADVVYAPAHHHRRIKTPDWSAKGIGKSWWSCPSGSRNATVCRATQFREHFDAWI